jgi:hypothetical protein
MVDYKFYRLLYRIDKQFYLNLYQIGEKNNFSFKEHVDPSEWEVNWIRYELTLPKTQPMICGKYTKKYGILF